MKIIQPIFAICLLVISFIGPQNVTAQGNNTSVKISETDKRYELEARFNKSKTRKVQEYMTESLRGTSFKFTNTQLDANLTLTGGITFYIKSHDGELVLKFDKRKNNKEDYTKFKKMCEGIKDLVEKD
jgi:hypothetical protein